MDAHLAELLEDKTEFIFDVYVDNVPRTRVFGPSFKRNWVMWRLSKYVLALQAQDVVSVKRWINGKWEDANDWRQLSH